MVFYEWRISTDRRSFSFSLDHDCSCGARQVWDRVRWLRLPAVTESGVPARRTSSGLVSCVYLDVCSRRISDMASPSKSRKRRLLFNGKWLSDCQSKSRANPVHSSIPKRSALGRVPRRTSAATRGGHRRVLPDSPCYHFGIGIIIRLVSTRPRMSYLQMRGNLQLAFSPTRWANALAPLCAISTPLRRLDLSRFSST